MGRTYCDDNYGCRVLETEEDVEWYHEVQRVSVWKKIRTMRSKSEATKVLWYL